MSDHEEEMDWHEFNAFMKERHREHVAKNMTDYEKYLLQMEFLGFVESPQGAGHRFTHPNGVRIDFWRQSGKWTIVGSNQYELGPRKMVKRARELAGLATGGPIPPKRVEDSGVGFTVKGTVTTPTNWPPALGTKYNTEN